MFRGNTPLKIEQVGAHDRHGQATVGAASKSRCSIVKLTDDRTRTSVRRDTSATGGNAHEITSDARLLIERTATIQPGCRITVLGVTLRVDGVYRRNDVHGVLHHFQVDCSIWV